MSELDLLFEAHERERFAFLALTEAEQAREQIRTFYKCKADPWAFLSQCVWTRDQVDPVHKIKPYPRHLEYLKFFAHAWQRYLHIAVPKSRRMTMSWTCIPLFLWDTIFHPGSDNAFVSKKQDDAGELVERAEFVFQKIPEWRIPRALLPKIRNGRMTKDPPALVFEDILSKITGFPMGADQLRQFTFSGVFGDECAFWEQAEDFYAATKPTIDGGGRMTLVSSRSPGFFKKIVFDKIDHPDYNFPEIPPVEIKHPMVGVETWQNPTNKFLVIDLHYTANPEKRSKAWYQGVRSSMPVRKFMKEYEKSWQTFDGLPVYGDFVRTTHVKPSLDPELGLPLLIGVDFGLTPAFVVAQLINGNLHVLREFIATNEGIKSFAPKVWQQLRIQFTQWTNRPDDMILTYVDPAGFARSQVDERTCAEALRTAGFTKLYPGPVDFESRKEAVELFLTKHSRHGAGLQIDERYCPILIEGFAGGYQFPPKSAEVEPSKARPIKNAWSHVHDGTQYLCWGAIHVAKQHGIDLTPPAYGFQNTK